MMSLHLSRTVQFLLLIGALLLTGCAANIQTKPEPLALQPQSYPEETLAILPLGKFNPIYGEQLTEEHRRWFLPRWLYGSGEVTILEDPYEDFALALYNRLRGYNVFRRVVIVKNRDEADELHARYVLCFRINDCYAVGEGPNLAFSEWLTYKGVAKVDIIVYDLAASERIAAETLQSEAFNTSVWSTPDVRNYLRRTLLKGQTFHNLIAQIKF